MAAAWRGLLAGMIATGLAEKSIMNLFVREMKVLLMAVVVPALSSRALSADPNAMEISVLSKLTSTTVLLEDSGIPTDPAALCTVSASIFTEVEGFNNEMFDTEIPFDVPVLTKPQKYRHKIFSETEIDDIAKSRLSINTENQTKWSVRLFRGEKKKF